MTEQSIPALQELYRSGGAADIAAWIERSIQAFKTAFQEFPASVIRTELCPDPYPSDIAGGFAVPEMQGRLTLAAAFTLGYAAGAGQDVDMVLAYEVLLNTLESMRFHYEITYGMMCPTGEVPHFIVKVPALTTGYLIIRVMATPRPNQA